MTSLQLPCSEAPYEARSKRWSDDLGFQSSNPWSDFRGGGWESDVLIQRPCAAASRPPLLALLAVLGWEAQSSGTDHSRSLACPHLNLLPQARILMEEAKYPSRVDWHAGSSPSLVLRLGIPSRLRASPSASY